MELLGLIVPLSLEGIRPAALQVDDFVDFLHEADGFVEGDDDAVVVGEVVGGEGPALAVFEPFLADLVAADVEVPDLFGDAVEADGAGHGIVGAARAALGLLGLDRVQPDRVVRPAHLLDDGGGGAGEGKDHGQAVARGDVVAPGPGGLVVAGGEGLLHRGLNQVEGDEFAAELGQGAEQFEARRQAAGAGKSIFRNSAYRDSGSRGCEAPRMHNGRCPRALSPCRQTMGDCLRNTKIISQ